MRMSIGACWPHRALSGAAAPEQGLLIALAPGDDHGVARFTLKDDNIFVLADALGDIDGGDGGLFWDDTRMLARLQLRVAGLRPSLLGAAISQDNVLFTAQLTN